MLCTACKTLETKKEDIDIDNVALHKRGEAPQLIKLEIDAEGTITSGYNNVVTMDENSNIKSIKKMMIKKIPHSEKHKIPTYYEQGVIFEKKSMSQFTKSKNWTAATADVIWVNPSNCDHEYIFTGNKECKQAIQEKNNGLLILAINKLKNRVDIIASEESQKRNDIKKAKAERDNNKKKENQQKYKEYLVSMSNIRKNINSTSLKSWMPIYNAIYDITMREPNIIISKIEMSGDSEKARIIKEDAQKRSKVLAECYHLNLSSYYPKATQIEVDKISHKIRSGKKSLKSTHKFNEGLGLTAYTCNKVMSLI